MDTRPEKLIKIDITDVIAELETIQSYVRREFSGFCWGAWVKSADGYSIYKIYRYELLDVGTSVFTQINPESVVHTLQYADLKNMKVWQHAHPMGDARMLGAHNWSGTDDHTACFEPLGSTPEMMKWSISIVRTPTGWAGRLDNYGANPETIHCEVFPNPLLELGPTMDAMIERARTKYVGNGFSEIGPGYRAGRWTDPEFADEDDEDEEGIWLGMGEDPEDEDDELFMQAGFFG